MKENLRFVFTERFTESYKKLDNASQKAIQKALRFLSSDRHHPSLRTKKMEGTDFIFEASASMSVRITFHYAQPDTIILRNCGYHDRALGKP